MSLLPFTGAEGIKTHGLPATLKKLNEIPYNISDPLLSKLFA
jgi:hypothetical protein